MIEMQNQTMQTKQAKLNNHGNTEMHFVFQENQIQTKHESALLYFLEMQKFQKIHKYLMPYVVIIN